MRRIGLGLGEEALGEAGEGASGVFLVEGVEGLVLEAFGAEESPGKADGAVGEGGFGGAGGGQFGEHVVAVGLELAGVFAGDDGLVGEEAVLDGKETAAFLSQ